MDELKKLVQTGENDIGNAGQAVGHFVGGIGRDIAGGFQSAVHDIGNAFSGGQQPQGRPAPPPQQQDPQLSLPGTQSLSGQTTHPIGLPQQSDPTNPTGLSAPNMPVGTIRLGPNNQDVNANLKAQAQQNAIKIRQQQEPGMAQQLSQGIASRFGNDVNTIRGAVSEGANDAKGIASGLAHFAAAPFQTAIINPIREEAATATHNPVALTHAQQAAVNDNPFNGTIGLGNDIATAVVAPHVEQQAEQSAQNTYNTLSQAYPNNPIAQSFAQQVANQNRQDMLNQLITSGGVAPTTPTIEVAKKVGGDVVNATNPIGYVIDPEAALLRAGRAAGELPDIASHFHQTVTNNMTPLDETGGIANPFQRKYNGLPQNQVIMDTSKLDVLNNARQVLTSGTEDVNYRNQINQGLHQIKNDNGLDFITGSNADRLQRISQYLEQNGEAIPRLQNGQADGLLQPLNQIGAVGKDVTGAGQDRVKIAQYTNDGKTGEFWTTPEGVDNSYGSKLNEAQLDPNHPQLFKGPSSYDFLKERGLLTKEVQARLDAADDSPDPNAYYKVTQDIARKELQKEGYKGAHWTNEDDLNPTQYQLWDKSILDTPNKESATAHAEAKTPGTVNIARGSHHPTIISKATDAAKGLITPLDEGGYIRLPGNAPDDLVKKTFTSGTDDNSLYHGTKFDNAVKILEDGAIKASKPNATRELIANNSDGQVSLSRQRNSGFYNGKGADVKFVVDKDKLGKTTQYVDGELKPGDYTNPSAFEAEEQTKKDIPMSAIKRVEGGPLLEPEDEEQLRALAAKHNVPFVGFDDVNEMRAALPKYTETAPEEGAVKVQQSQKNLPKVSSDSSIAPKVAQTPLGPVKLANPADLPKLSPEEMGQALGLTKEQMANPARAPEINTADTKVLKRQSYVDQVAAKYGGLSDAEKADLPQKVQMALHEAENPAVRPPLTRAERATLIQNDPAQQTRVQIPLKAQDLKPAIAEAQGHVDEVHDLSEQAKFEARKLSHNDQAKLSDVLNGEHVGKVDDPARFNRVQQLYARAYDYGLAADRAAGGLTLRFNGGKYSPLLFKIDDKLADDMGIPQEDRIMKNGRTVGYRYQGREYKSYKEAATKSGGKLQPLYKNALEDADHYFGGLQVSLRKNLMASQLERLFPGEYDRDANIASKNGTQLSPTAKGNLPGAASDRLNKSLKNFQEAYSPDSQVGKQVENIVFKHGGAIGKKSLFFGSPFHQTHITGNVGAAIGFDHPALMLRAVEDAAKTGGGLSKGQYYDVLEKYRQDGTLRYARNAGLKLEGDGALGRFIDSYTLSLAKYMKDNGIVEGSEAATDYSRVANHLLGRENASVEGLSPTYQKFMRYFSLAPNYLRTQLKLNWEALAPKKLGGAGYDSLYSAKTPGGLARRSVVGPRAFGALFAIAMSSVIMHKFPTWQQAMQEAGLKPNNPNPNIQIKSKNAKGENQVMNLPTDPVGLLVGFLTDPSHFAISRESPGLSFGTKVVTNKNWNGDPLSDPNKPLVQQLPTRIKNAASNSFVPIGAQNYTNLQGNQNNPNVQQGTAQEFGLRLKTNPNDPQVQKNQQYFNQQAQYGKDLQSGNFGAINPALNGMDKKSAAYWSSQWKSYQDLSPGKDVNGVQNSSQWNALSSQQKNSYLLMNDPKGGGQTLSPIFYMLQQAAQNDPSRPHSPLYDLKGSDGVGFTLDAQGNVQGTQSLPRSQVALNYQNENDPTQKSLIMAANPWLSGYEQQVGDYSQNYQQNMTKYMQNEGWKQSAINQYWADHPNNPAPIQSAVTPGQQSLMAQYESITDPNAKSQFFDDNAKELSAAFTAAAVYSNQSTVAKGGLPRQLYPTPSPEVAGLLAQMQKNPTHDKGISKANALLIQNNPALNQYLADTGIYDLAKNVARYNYQDPAHPGMSAAQLLNLGRPIDQTTMKNVVDVGKYDIGYNKNAPAGQQYQFMGAGGNTGGFGQGYGSGGGYGKSSKKPMVPGPRRVKVRKAYLKKPPKIRRSGGKAYVPHTFHATHGSVSIAKGSNPLKPVRLLNG